LTNSNSAKHIDNADEPSQTREANNPPQKPSSAAEKLHALILKSIDDDKGQDIVSIALAGKSSIADYMVVASGTSTRQVAAMAQKLSERVKKQGGKCRIEGMTNADWVLIDAGDVIVHLFRPEVRSFYNLERMWTLDEETPDTAEMITE